MLKSFFLRSDKDRFSAKGANGHAFDDIYWREIYGRGDDVDGTFNAREHALYIHSLCNLLKIGVRSIFDFGFGKGILLKEFARIFNPAKIVAVDASIEMVNHLKKSDWIKKYNIALIHNSIQGIELSKMKYSPFDLGICNSVLQYIPDRDFASVVEKISLLAKYVYFTVPTDNDYRRMKKEIRFSDPYAYHRSRNFYLQKLKSHFTIVSFNLLESKIVSDKKFEDEIFRF